jgi:hypothetical protein
MLAILTCATKSFQYALKAQMPLLAENLRNVEPGHYIFVTDKSPESKKAFEMICNNFVPDWKMHFLDVLPNDEDNKDYGVNAQLRIAKMQGIGLDCARDLGVDELWSLESDILPPPNALKVMRQTLSFDDNYYDVAMVTYNNGSFLGGRGDSNHWIAEDFSLDEKIIPKRLEFLLKACGEKLNKIGELKSSPEDKKKVFERESKRMERLQKRVKECSPKENVFGLNAKRWRKRGWLENAYPAVGRGAILESDWCGLGNTLFSKKALNLANFNGYEGKGTQDLWLCWRCWKPNNIRISVIPHIVSHHVKPDSKSPSGYSVLFARHEIDGEYVGHLRCDKTPFYNHS